QFVRELDRVPTGRQLAAFGEDLTEVGSEDVVRLVARALAERHGDREEDWLTEIRGLYQVYRANVLAAADHRPGIHPGHLLAVACRRTDGDTGVDWTAGWPRYVAGEVSRFEIPGDHYSIVEEPDVAQLADILRPRLCD